MQPDKRQRTSSEWVRWDHECECGVMLGVDSAGSAVAYDRDSGLIDCLTHECAYGKAVFSGGAWSVTEARLVMRYEGKGTVIRCPACRADVRYPVPIGLACALLNKCYLCGKPYKGGGE